VRCLIGSEQASPSSVVPSTCIMNVLTLVCSVMSKTQYTLGLYVRELKRSPNSRHNMVATLNYQPPTIILTVDCGGPIQIIFGTNITE